MRKMNILLAIFATLAISSAYANCPSKVEIVKGSDPGDNGSYIGYGSQNRRWVGSGVKNPLLTEATFGYAEVEGTVDAKEKNKVTMSGSISCWYKVRAKDNSSEEAEINLVKYVNMAGQGGYELDLSKRPNLWIEGVSEEHGKVSYKCEPGGNMKVVDDCPFDITQPEL
jgi:hypothetical protein